jgi:hypothetical protein
MWILGKDEMCTKKYDIDQITLYSPSVEEIVSRHFMYKDAPNLPHVKLIGETIESNLAYSSEILDFCVKYVTSTWI